LCRNGFIKNEEDIAMGYNYKIIKKYIKYKYNADHPKLRELLISKLYVDDKKVTGKGGYTDVARAYYEYKKGMNCKFYLFYVSNEEKLRKVFIKEFKYEHTRFFIRLMSNRTFGWYYQRRQMSDEEAFGVVSKLPKSVREHPYIQIFLYHSTYIRASGSNIIPHKHSKLNIIPNPIITSIVPKQSTPTLYSSLLFLKYRYKIHVGIVDREVGDGYDEYHSKKIIKRYKVQMKYIYSYMNYATLYKIHRPMITDKVDKILNMKYNRAYNKSLCSIIPYAIIILLFCNRIDYVSYVLNRTDSDSDIEHIIKMSWIYKLPPERIRLFMDNNLLDNKLFKRIYHKLSMGCRGRASLNYKLLDMYFRETCD
jgi:hypothetical protein